MKISSSISTLAAAWALLVAGCGEPVEETELENRAKSLPNYPHLFSCQVEETPGGCADLAGTFTAFTAALPEDDQQEWNPLIGIGASSCAGAESNFATLEEIEHHEGEEAVSELRENCIVTECSGSFSITPSCGWEAVLPVVSDGACEQEHFTGTAQPTRRGTFLYDAGGALVARMWNDMVYWNSAWHRIPGYCEDVEGA